MKEIIYEYGGGIIGTVGAMGIFWLLRMSFFAADGPLSQLVQTWL